MRKKITVVGAGNVGASAAARLAEKGTFDVVLVDVQYSPQTDSLHDFRPYLDYLWRVGEAGDANVLHRYDAMRYYVENGKFENFYTVGLRGVHDSGLEATGTPQVKAKLVEDAMAEQRKLLAARVNPDHARVPQVIWLYKESLGLYRAGMKVPDDVTLGWTDDNYGYIREFSDARERRRSGGAGVYYHVSYFGRPRDYLWLCSTPPALIAEEMTKAYDYGADRVWMLNVGDLKPAAFSEGVLPNPPAGMAPARLPRLKLLRSAVADTRLLGQGLQPLERATRAREAGLGIGCGRQQHVSRIRADGDGGARVRACGNGDEFRPQVWFGDACPKKVRRCLVMA